MGKHLVFVRGDGSVEPAQGNSWWAQIKSAVWGSKTRRWITSGVAGLGLLIFVLFADVGGEQSQAQEG